ncbi:putative DUF341 family oxidoreductase [Aureobasidium pullulans]|nr:putative DUF341 family oxidoreductase [Aureobasidium pullulans]THZ31517.1 putative DUF341 family oxidoreductase [Aureobasidium pullulans]
MKFLCLHGAYGNIPAAKVQLGPMIDILEADGAASFDFIQGRVPVTPPPGFESYFGPGPHFRFLRDRGEAEASAVEGIRVFPEADTPEDALRALMPAGEAKIGFAGAREAALEQLYEALDADPEICGVVGYSEGASAAATLIYDEQQRMRSEGYVPRIKAAIFFMGWPALTSESVPALSDEIEDLLEVHSLHIIGANDPYKDGALALYNLFDDNMAIFFDSAGGHTIPRHGKLLQELAEAVKGLIANVHEDDSVQLPEPVKVAKRLDSAVNIPDLSALKLSHP